jgi:hypothetical protein
MGFRKQDLWLAESIAAVRLAGHADGTENGVAAIIPAGEIIHLDGTVPIVGRMRQIDWDGSAYNVFPEDLQARTP